MAASDCLDWQTTKRTVLERNSYMFGNSLMSDVQFVFQTERTRETFPAHKYVLSTASPVFFAMFCGELKEENGIQITDVSFKAFKEMLRFLYTDETNLDGDCVLEVLYLAKKYIVPSLVEKCSEFLEKNIDEKNALVVLEQGIKYDETAIIEKCWEVIEEEVKYIVKMEEFFKFSHDMLCTLLEREFLAIEEIDLFEAVDKWAVEQCRQKRSMCDGENKRKILGKALALIQFDIMDQENFATKVVVKDVLSMDEVKQTKLSLKSTPARTRDLWMGFRISTIIGDDRSYLKQLRKWLDSTATKGLQWEMCFNAKRDGFGARTFHRRCDNKKYTVTIVQVGEYIFGGYSDVSWSSFSILRGEFFPSSTCWLFSLKNADSLQPFQSLSTKGPKWAIACSKDRGPCFGGGYDLRISDNANTNKKSCSYFGLSYHLPPGYLADTPQAEKLLAGSSTFSVTNYEVFSTT